MKITSMEEYGLRCLVQVAKHGDKEPISAQDIAELEGISVAYAQKILRALNKGDLVQSVRGASGGYTLAREMDDISLGDAIRVLGGMLQLDHICEKHTGEQDVCLHASQCSIRPVWGSLTEFIMRTFDTIPLALLMRSEREVKSALMAMVPAPVETPSEGLSCPLEQRVSTNM